MGLIRLLRWLLLALFAVILLRSIIGAVAKGAQKLFGGRAPQQPQRPAAPAGGRLQRDPVCGTYVSEAISVQLKTDAGTLHFCSEACRQKYKG
jgi:YHS domain-containing protein